MLQNRSKLKELNKDSTKSKKIFINEDLTRTRAILAKRARSLLAEKRIDSTWVTGGVVLVKMLDNRIRKVSTEAHFKELDIPTAN